MSLEQGLGLCLTDIIQGRPSRTGLVEASAALRDSAAGLVLLIKLIRVPGFLGSPVPGFLDPGGSRNHLFSSNLLCQEKQIFLAL